MEEDNGDRPSLPAEFVTGAGNGILIKAVLERGEIQGGIGFAFGKV